MVMDDIVMGKCKSPW